MTQPDPDPTNREPQPSDGPEYHADHEAWERRQREQLVRVLSDAELPANPVFVGNLLAALSDAGYQIVPKVELERWERRVVNAEHQLEYLRRWAWVTAEVYNLLSQELKAARERAAESDKRAEQAIREAVSRGMRLHNADKDLEAAEAGVERLQGQMDTARAFLRTHGEQGVPDPIGLALLDEFLAAAALTEPEETK